jgi:hypothetical protein
MAVVEEDVVCRFKRRRFVWKRRGGGTQRLRRDGRKISWR